MKLKKMNWGRALAMGTVSLGFVQALSAATTLTGEGLTTNTIITANHGSNAVGTPDIALNWLGSGDDKWDNYNGWPSDAGGGVYQHNDDGLRTIEFAPTAGTAVEIISFDALDWAGGGGNTLFTWTVTGSVSGVLGTADISVPDGTTPTINLNITGVAGETLSLDVDQTGGLGSYFAIDNLTFDQVPEPSSTALLGLGLGAMAMRRRRK